MGKRQSPSAYILQFFGDRFVPDHLISLNSKFRDLAQELADRFPESPELTTGLRKLLEARDCIVLRAALMEEQQ